MEVETLKSAFFASSDSSAATGKKIYHEISGVQ